MENGPNLWLFEPGKTTTNPTVLHLSLPKTLQVNASTLGMNNSK